HPGWHSKRILSNTVSLSSVTVLLFVIYFLGLLGGVSMSRVRDIVQQRTLFSVEEHESVAEVARKMADLHVGAILVFNGVQLRGVFSERDLMKRVVVERCDPDRTSVGS